MKLRNIIRATAVVGLASSLLVSCGSSDSRDRNVGTTELCNQGGACTVGEVGPAGGIVVFGTTEPGVDMWEVAPMNGYGTFDEAFALVDDLEFGGKTGWTLPNADVIGHIKEALASFACAPETDCGTEFGEDTYWSSDLDGEAHVVFSVDGTTATAEAGSTHFFRPVRSFQIDIPDLEVDPVEDKGNPGFYTTTTTEPETTTTEEPTTTTEPPTTTLPPTTTTTTILADASCADGGPCAIGDTGPGGGVVFYVGESDFTSAGSDCGERCRYLEITKSDQSMGTPWVTAASVCYGDGSDAGRSVCTWNNSIYPASMNQSAARVASEAIGMGMSNTNQIYSRMTTAGGVATNAYAAGVAWAYEDNGKTDWFLPSKAELGEVYKQRGVIPGITVNTSQSASTYQSSTEVTAFYSWAQTISTGFGSSVNKTAGYRVRAIRAFGPRVVAFAVGTTTTTSTTTTTTLPPTTTTTSTTTTVPRTTTTTIAEGDRIAAIDARFMHTCLRMVDARMKCRGYNTDGQLGRNNSSNSESTGYVVGLGTASQLTGVTRMSVGQYHTCAILAGGRVACWGKNSVGQVGSGDNVNKTRPVEVPEIDGSTVSKRAIAISAGASHTCALIADGTIKCWGSNQYGQLGTTAQKGVYVTSPDTVKVFDGKSDATKAVAVAAGFYSTCAVAKTGRLFCWGAGSSGLLGLGNSDSKSEPTAVPFFDGSSSAKRVAKVTVGEYAACAINQEDSLFCWGNNADGRLGLGDTTTRNTPTRVPFPSGEDDGAEGEDDAVGVLDVTINAAMCATLSNGEVWCSGTNADGRLGNDKVNKTSNSPVLVDKVNGATRELSSIAIASGSVYVCSLEESQTTVFCWGSNDKGAAGFSGNQSRNPKITS